MVFLLGAAEAKPMRVYYSHWSQTLNDRTPANIEALARKTREEGWTCIKWVLPKGGTELERLRRLTAEVEAARTRIEGLDPCRGIAAPERSGAVRRRASVVVIEEEPTSKRRLAT